MNYDEDIGISITSPDNVNTLKKVPTEYVYYLLIFNQPKIY